MAKKLPCIIVLLCFIFIRGLSQADIDTPPLAPYPNHLDMRPGTFSLNVDTRIVVNSGEVKKMAEPLRLFLEEVYAIAPEVQLSKRERKNSLHLLIDTDADLPADGYAIDINHRRVKITAPEEEGLFYGIHTLLQLFSSAENAPTLPNLYIKDFPRFGWRGMHLDVSRHFMPVYFIKKYLDLMAMYKLNVFHWHLVDGIGWRIEIKSHPELTDIGAWRVVKEGKKPWEEVEAWKAGDSRPKYGGFYTQEEIKDIIAYAEERFITIVPEIELPGHSEIVFECFENLVCKDSTGHHLDNIGVYCASNPESYQLLEDVLTEVIDLFPSKYIHIGGDEVNKANWEQCAGCKKLMQEKGYDSHELQSYFVNHFDRFIQARGRKLMGWDEITQGNLSSSASIMYWHGMDGLRDMLAKKHPTVIASGTSYYFDHYQSLSEYEPPAWGGYSPLSQVYHLEPVPVEIDENLQRFVLGIQAQIWTEYMPTPAHVEYMLLPRMLALAESAWTLPEHKDWQRFSTAVLRAFKTFDAQGINYANSALRPLIDAQLEPGSRKLRINISSEIPTEIRYTTDGSTPSATNGFTYTKPFLLDTNATVSAVSVGDGKTLTEPERMQVFVHKALGRDVQLKNKPHPRYSANGGASLVDMVYGGRTWGSGKWIGVLDQDLEVVIDLEKPVEVSRVILSCIKDNAAGIYFPKGIEILVSQDGETFSSVTKWERDLTTEADQDSNNRRRFSLEFAPKTCKFIQIKAQCLQLDNKGVFIFADEIIVL